MYVKKIKELMVLPRADALMRMRNGQVPESIAMQYLSPTTEEMYAMRDEYNRRYEAAPVPPVQPWALFIHKWYLHYGQETVDVTALVGLARSVGWRQDLEQSVQYIHALEHALAAHQRVQRCQPDAGRHESAKCWRIAKKMW